MLRSFIFVLALTCASPAYAYTCTVEQYFDLYVDVGLTKRDVDGPLVRGKPGYTDSVENIHASRIVGKRFHINTRTGLIDGFDMLDNDLAESRSIISQGGSGQSFILLSVWGPITASRYIEVKSFAVTKGKPFVAIVDGSILSGTCY